jgi:hypothetical protein
MYIDKPPFRTGDIEKDLKNLYDYIEKVTTTINLELSNLSIKNFDADTANKLKGE